MNRRRQRNREPKVCNYYDGSPGSCKFGDKCSMLHAQPGQKTSGRNAETNKNYDRNRGNKGQRRGSDKPTPILPNLIEIIKPKKRGFRAIPIIPTEEELLAQKPEIPKNRIDEGYDSIDEYLETHYKLLREDCVRSLRKGIRFLKTESIESESESEEQVQPPRRFESEEQFEKKKPLPEEQFRDLRVYAKVNLVGVVFASIGVVHRISFRTKDFERVIWSKSKRLLPGTLVIFSNDNFETMKFGTVVNRPMDLLEKSFDLQIDVLFRLEDIEFEWPEGYMMVESTSSYFEAYRHVLNVLQELDPETLPFKEHIVERDTDIDIPEYLESRYPVYEFGKTDSFRTLEASYGTSRLNIRKEWDEWPTIEEMNTEMHISQYEALKRMLTCRLALVQGPPGTGKTYIGLATVSILLENLPGTIVIACQTNHALDQFLEGIQRFEENIVRLGSRSNSDRIKPRTLYNLRQDARTSSALPKNREINRLFAKKENIETEMMQLCKEIGNPCLGLDYVIEQGYLTDRQISSLKQDDWVTSSSSRDDDSRRDYIQEWLEASISSTTLKQNDIDFQLSQLMLQDSGEQVEEEEEYDEETIRNVEEEFQGVDDGQQTKGEFIELRSEKCIQSDVYVSEDTINEHLSSDDLWSIPQEVRVAIHNRWRRIRLEEIIDKLKKLCKQYFELCGKIKTERIREDLFILKSARVVGMTTTAAAKYHDLLINLAPKIMVIEEAAETLEAHVITALTPATQHLILIGDHQQLRPITAVHSLAKTYNLDVSLFERLTKFLPYCQLTEQRRMRPEIRELLTPIYQDVLTDHEKVLSYPSVPGFCDNLFFFDHQEDETHVEETRSKINKFEANMCAKFANYLVNGGTDAKRITILSMYSGQKRYITQLLRDHIRTTPEIKEIKVCSVDSFQGEENDVILLSLVRSRDPRYGIGFLGVSNRICVALSRAKHGMYIFGNTLQLRKQSDLWSNVIKILERAGLCGQYIYLYCQKHSNLEDPGSLIRVRCYTEIPVGGGCSLDCGEVMECGHICPNKCHITPHDKFTCMEKCIRKLPCGHLCNRRCDEPCGGCETMVPIKPTCGHYKEIKCHTTNGYRCMEPCSKKLTGCGHQCKEVCSSWCTTICRVPIPIKCPRCGHSERTFCFNVKDKLEKGCRYC